MQYENKLLPRTWSTESVMGDDVCPPSLLPRTWSTESVMGDDVCPPSPIVSPVAPPVAPVSRNKVSFDLKVEHLHYMVDTHMKSTIATKKAKKARKAAKKAARKVVRKTRLILSTQV